MTSSQTQPRRPQAARYPCLVLAACGLAMTAAPAAAQLTEPFPAVFELSSLTPAAGGDGTLGLVITPNAGFSVSSARDVNGDGVDDVIVGRPSGPSWVVFGRPGGGFPPEIDAMALDGSDGFRLVGGAGDVGFSVSSAGDMNSDGIDDVIIAGTTGEAFVVFGRAAGFPAEVDLTGLGGTDGFRVLIPSRGMSVVSSGAAGDVNGDGVDDVVLGVANGILGGFGGEVFVIFGREQAFPATIDTASLNGADGFHLTGGIGSKRLGAAVAGARDINGDGLDDIVVGAPGYYEQYGCQCFDPGSAYVVFGREQFPASFHVSTLTGENGFHILGFGESTTGVSVAPAGDFNDDGVDDVLIGAPYPGLAAVIFGRDATGGASFPGSISLSSMDPAAGVRLEGAQAMSVGGGSDVNGDGIADVIVGDPNHYAPGRDGGSYVVYGRAALPASILLQDLDGEDGFRLDGAGGSWQFGTDANGEGVASAGDVNGDGVADMIFAGPSDRPAYIVFGRMPDGPCYADCDQSGALDFFDFLCFQNLFAAGDPKADCDESGELDFFDFLCFQNAFAAGCP